MEMEWLLIDFSENGMASFMLILSQIDIKKKIY